VKETKPPQELEIADPETESQLPVERKPGGDCTLRVDTDPQGAKILVDGKERGISSTQLALSCNQSINLTLQLEGYESVSENLSMNKETEKVVKSLRRIPTGTVEFTFNRNVQVMVDGAIVGQATANEKFEISVRAGKEHLFVFENQIFGLREELKLIVQPDTVMRRKIRLDNLAPRLPAKKRNE
jgi:archaellum component FlaG (FlaF/FlaG flagellin family)